MHSSGRESLQVVEGFRHALAAEAVQTPKQYPFEAPLVRIEKKLLELGPRRGAPTFLIAVRLKR